MSNHRAKAHPVWLTILGFFFGLFLAVFLVFAGVVALDSAALTVLPVVLAVLGLVLGLVGRARVRRAAAPAEPATPVAA